MENVETQQNLKRKISLEEDFMDHSKGNDIIYGFMLNQATFNPETKQLYLTKNRYKKISPYIKSLFYDKERHYITRSLNKLIELGLIQESYVDLSSNLKHVPAYIFPNQDLKKYKLINNDMLFYVVMTRNICAVRIYTYLLNKYEWKQNNGGGDYEFTYTELRQALGWPPTTRTCNEIIDINLRSFAREGIIKYVDTFKKINEKECRPCKLLKFVAIREDQLPKVNGEYAQKKKELKEI